MKAPETKPTVKLTGRDGNAFAIMGAIKKALRQGGADKEYVDQYMKDAMSGDYDHLLQVSMECVDVE